MKKSNKILLITGLATVTIGTAGILHTNYMQNQTIGSGKIKAYNHQPANILDNVFMKDNTKYLPFILESATESDNITPKIIKKNDVVAAFAQKGLTIKNISTGEKIVTGTQITVQENSDVYHVVIYGDINADGQVNVLDVQKIIRHVIYMGEHELAGTYKIAANLHNSDEEVNVLDAQRIIRFCLDPVKNKILLNEPVSDKEADNVAPEITLKGQANVELEQGASYSDEGATATDNYDGDVTAEISIKITFKAEGSSEGQTVTNVDTNQIGTYTITYTATDSNGNSASKTRTIVIKEKTIVNPPTPSAKVESIELVLSGNFKTQYQYGEATTLDLTGAQITVKTDDGNTTTKNVTNSMLSSYDLTTEGTKTITVTYEGVSATDKIEITVLNKISELVMSNTGMNNVQTIETGYQTNSKEDFILGTIQAKQEEGGSTLQQSQLKVTSTVTATTDSTVTANDLTVSFEKDTDGNILVKGKAEKVGNYTIKVYIEYGSQKVEKAIALTVKKSDVVGRVIVAPTEENEVIKIGKVAKRKLTVINVNEEEIEVSSGNIVITPETGITIKKLDSAGGLIGEDHSTTIVSGLQIETTLNPTVSQTITMQMTVNGKAADFTFTVKAKSVLSKVKITEDQLDVHTVLPNPLPSENNVILGEDNINIYTLIKPTFEDQYQEDIPVKVSDIRASVVEADVDEAVENGKIGILLPKVNVKVPLLPVEVPDSCIDFNCYKDGVIKTGENEINQIGFSIILNNPNKTVNLTELEKAKIVIKVKGQAPIELPIKVHYKKLANLGIDTSTTTLTRDEDTTEVRYVTNVAQEFTLGTVTVGTGEEPVKANMLTTKVIGNSAGIKIEYNEVNGKIVVTGTILSEGVYQVRTMLKPEYGDVLAPIGIEIEGIAIPPQITSIDMADFEMQIGEKAVQKDLIVKSDINPTLQPIKAKELTFEQRDNTTDQVIDCLDIKLKNQSGQTFKATERPTEIVKSLEISAKGTVSTAQTVKLKIILFAGEENEYFEEVIISIRQPQPKAIEVGSDLTLYDTQGAENTVLGSDGCVYTLVPIQLFVDAEKNREIMISSNLFVNETSEEQENKVCIVKPKLPVTIMTGIPATDMHVLEIKYFNASKAEANKEIAYIGVAMKKQTDKFTYDKTQFNNRKTNHFDLCRSNRRT